MGQDEIGLYDFVLVINGILHIFSNMTDDVLQSLKHYAWWWARTRPIAALLINKWSQDLLVATCFLGREGAWQFVCLIRAVKTRPIEWRFVAVLLFLREILDLKDVLPRFWDAGRFAFKDDDAESNKAQKFSDDDISLADKGIKSVLWWRYGSMLLLLCVGCHCDAR